MRRHDLGNLSALTAIQIANAALPLVVFPYVLAVVGAEAYAQIVVTEALALIVLAVVLYSFEVDGVAKVVDRDPRVDSAHISRTYSEIFWTRMLLLACASAVMLGATMMVAPDLAPILGWWMLVPCGYILQSLWLFQGLERNLPAAVAIVLSRVGCIALVLLFVREPGDHGLVPAFIGLSTFLAGACSLAYAFWRLKVRLVAVPLRKLVDELRVGREIFLGNASVLLYRDLNVLLLTAAGGSQTAIATYSLAEKIVKGIQASMRPLNQLYFPKAMRLTRQMQRAGVEAFRGILGLTLPQWLGLGVLVAIIGGAYAALHDRIEVVATFPGREEVALLVGVMSLAVFFGVGNFMFGTAGLNQLGERRYLLRALAGVGVVSVALCVTLARQLGSVGAALAFVLSEVLLFSVIARRYWTARA